MDVASCPPDPPVSPNVEPQLERETARELRELRDPADRADLEREYSAIYTREYPVALTFARRFVDGGTAEDVVQTVFMKYWAGYTRTPPLVFRADTAHTQAAILTAVRHELATASQHAKTARRKRRHVRRELVEHLRVIAAPERPLTSNELALEVTKALVMLPERQRDVFMFVKFDGMSYEQVGATLGISAKTVHQHLARANERLRDILAEYRTRDAASYSLHDEQVVGRRRDGHE